MNQNDRECNQFGDNRLLKNRITMLILSCDKFSDLWEGHVKLLEKYWPDRNINTYIVTDKVSDMTFDNVSVFSIEGVEWSDRLKLMLEQVNTEYILVTLDDYFLTKKVTNNKIGDILDMMHAEKIDYTRLFLRPKRATKKQLSRYKNIYEIDTTENYSVNLYTGIWEKSFLLQAAKKSCDIWEFEVSLSKIANEINAKCVVDKDDVFHILDVVRKGKLLHKAARYFKMNPDIYTGSREVNTWDYEIKLGIRTCGVRYAPRFIVDLLRNAMIKCGHHYYSQDI